MGNFHKTGPTTSAVHCRFTSLRRLWNMKPRSMKPAIMVLAFLVVSLVLNSLLLMGTRTPQEMKGDTALLPSEPLTPQPKVQPTVIAQYPSPAASQKWASAAQESSDRKKIKGLNSENNIKKAGATMQPLRANVAMTTRGKQKTKTSTTTENFVPVEWEKMKANERLFETGYDKHIDIPVWKYLKPKEEQSNANVQELSFGFVNSNFKPPDLSQTNLVDLMGLMENSTKRKTGLNPGSIIGSVIGAVVEAKKFMSEGGNQDVQYDSDVNKFPVGEKQSADAKGATDRVNQNNTDSDVLQSDVYGASNTSKQDKERENKAFKENAPKLNSKGPLRDANTLGTLVSKYGPSLFSLAFNTDGQTQSHDANSSPLMSFMGSLGPLLLSKSLGTNEGSSDSKDFNPMFSMISNMGANLLSNGFPQMSAKERNGSLGSPNSQKPDLIHSLVSGVGPLLMASVVGGGLSSKNRNNGSPTSSEAKSPMQSILSGLGPALIGGTVQNLLGNSNSGSGGLHSEKSPVQSVISGLAPVLLAGALGQGYSAEGRSNSKTFEGNSAGPLQSLMSGLGPAVLKAVGQGLGAGFSETDPAKGASSLGGLISNMAPMLMGGGISTRAKQKSNSVNSYSNSPPHETVRERNISKTDDPTSVNGDSAAPPPEGTAVSGEATPLGRSPPGLSMDGMLMKSVARAAFARLLPDRISVPEVNSTKGLWHMAVNLALGNPRQESGRNGIFWNWLREYGGIDGTSGAETPPSWITKSLESPERLQYAEEVKKLHWTMTQPQPLCQRLEMIGGVFNWKVNLMEDERAVCLDNDVAPQKTDCLVYNFGRVTEWILEEALESIGCEVYVFDPTDEKGNHNHTRGIHFYSVGLSDVNAIRKVDGQVLRLFTLSSILDHFGHETTPIAYMRLGIGSDVWKVLQQVVDDTPQAISNVKQLSLEVNLELALRDPSLYKKYVDLLEVLESLGFQLFFSKPVQNQENVSFLDPLVGEEVSLSYQMVFLRI